MGEAGISRRKIQTPRKPSRTPRHIATVAAIATTPSTSASNAARMKANVYGSMSQLSASAMRVLVVEDVDGAALPDREEVALEGAREDVFGEHLDGGAGGDEAYAKVDVKGKIVVAANPQYLAGSAQLTDACVAHAIQAAGLSLHDAWNMASRNTARALKVEEHRLARGSRADLVLFEQLAHAWHVRADDRRLGDHGGLMIVAQVIADQPPLLRRRRLDHEDWLGPLHHLHDERQGIEHDLGALFFDPERGGLGETGPAHADHAGLEGGASSPFFDRRAVAHLNSHGVGREQLGGFARLLDHDAEHPGRQTGGIGCGARS